MSHFDNTATITQEVEVAIIGAGTAGQSAFKQVRKYTDQVVIINDGFWTTTCATTGCMPSKLLIAAADRAYHAKNSAEFGVEAQVTIDGKQVMTRVRELRDFFTSHVQSQVDSWDDTKKIYGRATINQDGLIEVNDEVISARHLIIATGSTPFVPEGWRERLGQHLITSQNVFELPDLPKSLAVVGAGAIGLELAQSFHRLGVSVTLFNRSSKVGGLTDAKVNEQACECFSRELNVAFDSEITEVGVDGDQAYLVYNDKAGKKQQWRGELVLAATGRRNTLKELGVDHLGVVLDDDHQPQDLDITTGQIGKLNVYIVGDANAHLPLLHVASNEGYRAGADLRQDAEADNPSLRSVAPSIAVVFSEPQIFTVGQSLAKLEASSARFATGEVDFGSQGRSRVMGVNCGLLRIYGCQDTDKILGASMVGPDAEYIAHILATAIINDLTVTQLLNAPFYHPTILEGLRTALRDLQDNMQRSDHSANHHKG